MHSYSNEKVGKPRVLCLNPCFNGRCTRTIFYGMKPANENVLILVLMEDALVLGVELYMSNK